MEELRTQTQHKLTDDGVGICEGAAEEILNRLLSDLNVFLLPDNAGLRLDFDLDAIPALVERRQEKWDKLNACTFLTVNEKRQAIGYSPLSSGRIDEN